jgi:hypothetical protein
MPWSWTQSGAPNPEKFRAEVVGIMRDWTHDFTILHEEQNLSGRRGDMGVRRRTGNLAQGWMYAVEESGDSIMSTAWIMGPAGDAPDGAEHSYAWVQEYGATIRPKNAKWLWIPTEANQTPSGEARIKPTEAIERGGFISFKRGPVFFAKPLVKTRKSDLTHGLVALFVLKKEVIIPPRMGANSLWQQRSGLLSAAIAMAAGGCFDG